jgi:ferric-dicitrate binding protein FerR (iron transport regulator)
VTLKGEAFFRVQKDGSPFVVSTEVGTVRVLGTEFNVKVRGGALELAVLRGSVRLSVARNGVDSGVVVNKDQIVTCSREAFPQEPGPLRFSSFPGWMHGKLMFYRTPLSSACEEIEARFDVVVRLRNPRLQNETITGVVDAQNVDSALTALTRLAGTAYRNEQGVYTLY